MKPLRSINNLIDQINPLSSFDKAQVLDRLGVEPRRSMTQRWMPPAGGFGIGFMFGIGVGMLVAPKSGKELREDLRSAVSNWRSSSRDEETESEAKAEHETSASEASEESSAASNVQPAAQA